MKRNYHDELQALFDKCEEMEEKRRAALTPEELAAEQEQRRRESQARIEAARARVRQGPPEEELAQGYAELAGMGEEAACICGMNMDLKRKGTRAYLELEDSMLVLEDGPAKEAFLTLADLSEALTVLPQENKLCLLLQFDLCEI